MKDRLREILSAMPRVSALVVGDLFLDEYLVGRPSRISREAPVLVLEHVHSFSGPGGGAAPAVNVATLGGSSHVAGIVGDDPAGQQLLNHLNNLGIDTSAVLVSPHRGTTRKMRIVAQGSLRFPQQLVRIDFQDRSDLEPAIASQFLERIEPLGNRIQLLLLSDYLSGVVSTSVARALLRMAHTHRLVTAADAQGALDKYHGYDLVKCNKEEASAFLRRPLEDLSDCASAAQELVRNLNLRAALITLGPQGLVLAWQGKVWHIPAMKQVEVYDVTGAGDVVVTVAGMALAAWATPLEAAVLANLAGGIAVQRWGNAPAHMSDLQRALEEWDEEVVEDPS